MPIVIGLGDIWRPRFASRAPARRKLPVWTTFRRAAELWASQFRYLFAIGIVIGVPIGLVDALTSDLDGSGVSFARAAALIGASLAGFTFVLFAGQLYEGLAGHLVAEVERGRSPALPTLVRSLPIRRLLLVNVLYIGGTVIGLLLFVVPGIFFFTVFAPVATLITVEPEGIGPTFRRSRDLVRGSFWRVLLIVGAGYLIASELDQAISSIEVGTVGRGFVADWVVATLTTALLTPIAAVAAVVVTLRLIDLSRAE